MGEYNLPEIMEVKVGKCYYCNKEIIRDPTVLGPTDRPLHLNRDRTIHVCMEMSPEMIVGLLGEKDE